MKPEEKVNYLIEELEGVKKSLKIMYIGSDKLQKDLIVIMMMSIDMAIKKAEK